MTKGKITLTLHDTTYVVDGLDNDLDCFELLEQFKRLMVNAGYSPSVLDDEEGYWDWHRRED